MKKINLTILFILILIAGAFKIKAQMPLEYGEAVMTGVQRDVWNPFDNYDPANPVVQIFDVRNRPSPSGTQWNPPKYHHASWEFGTVDGTGVKTDKLGCVFGITMDKIGNIYVTDFTTLAMGVGGPGACSGTHTDGAYQLGAMFKGIGGSGAVYKIDAKTGATSIFSVLPNPAVFPVFNKNNLSCQTYSDPYGRSLQYRGGEDPVSGKKVGVGLGNICYDREHDQLFVTNRENGKIYRISMSGTTLSTYDPFNDDDGLNGLAPLNERIWGIGYYDGKVYFGLQKQEIGTSTKNEVWSVHLNSTGDFAAANSEVLEVIVNHPSGYNGTNGGDGTSWVANPISDISFTSEGKMMVTSKTMITDFCERAHFSFTNEYTPTGTGWSSEKLYYTGGSASQLNSAGGLDYGYSVFDSSNGLVDLKSREKITWITSNAIDLTSGNVTYGMQGTLTSNNGTPYTTNNNVDWDGNNQNNIKGSLGDVEVFREICQDTVYTVCSDGSETLQLTAESGLINVIWYDSTTNTQIGTGSVLNIHGSESFLSDSYEAIYYTATDASSCPWELCCLVRIRRNTCLPPCSLTSAGKANEACNSNNTPAVATDDYVTFSLNPTGTGLSPGYTVSVNGGATITPVSGTYGSVTNFQLQNGSANGTVYTITVTDNSTGSCQVTTTVQKNSCSTCPTPDCLDFQVKKN